jgi:hypothetical protein
MHTALYYYMLKYQFLQLRSLYKSKSAGLPTFLILNS